MSLSGRHPLQTMIIVSISLVSNGFVYMLVGYILIRVWRLGKEVK
jgi:hypothetical protein